VAYQIITADPDRRGARPYLAFGTLVDNYGSRMELYYLFPLDDEVNAANLVRTTLIVTGVALVALLAIIAMLVTRMVVRPVRVAARTAQRLSAGLLDQRMEVRGEDDLARLAASFNHMAANLQRQIVRLEEMSRLQRRFTSDVSHELRTPLTTVRMAADMIFSSREDFDAPVARSAELLQTELDRFESLLSDLLEISRFDAGFAVLDAEPTDVAQVVHRVVERICPLAERVGCGVKVHTPDSPVIAEIDPRRVERILRNLIGNAVEHGEGRPVRVTLGADEGAVAVTVRDHGVGLRPGEDKLVFNRFWRADPSRARQTGGTGLGLSISLEDARLHGGWLDSWGAPGQGAQFRLTLPVRSGDRLIASPLRLVPDDAQLDEGHIDDGQIDDGQIDGARSGGARSDGARSDGARTDGTGPADGARMLAMAALDEAADALDETVAALDTTTGTLGEKARANSGGEVPARERDRLPVTVDGGSTDG
jgi:two-component system sensor histidine kinase MtrB